MPTSGGCGVGLMSDTRTYSLSIQGEVHTYSVEAWRELTFEQLCNVLSDLTGYSASYLRRDLPRRFGRLGYASARPAVSAGGDPPEFLIRSSDGGKP
jgi:hypothetical protein